MRIYVETGEVPEAPNSKGYVALFYGRKKDPPVFVMLSPADVKKLTKALKTWKSPFDMSFNTHIQLRFEEAEFKPMLAKLKNPKPMQK